MSCRPDYWRTRLHPDVQKIARRWLQAHGYPVADAGPLKLHAVEAWKDYCRDLGYAPVIDSTAHEVYVICPNCGSRHIHSGHTPGQRGALFTRRNCGPEYVVRDDRPLQQWETLWVARNVDPLAGYREGSA